MENATKALYIAGMLLIALLVVALVAHTFNDVGIVQDEKDKKEYEESIYKFNREYEVFNKKVMYGTDVISCINKAESNNQKYEKSGKYSTTGASGQEVLIQVVVKLAENKPLEESIEFKYIKNEQNSKEYTYSSHTPDVIAKFENNLNNDSVGDFFHVTEKDVKSEILNKKLIDVFKTNTYKNNAFPQISSLLDGYGTDLKLRLDKDVNKSNLYYLTKNSDNLERVVYNNKDGTGMYSLNSNVWSSIIWKTCLSDFKSRKFKCKEINYNKDTGLVDYIYFDEIN